MLAPGFKTEVKISLIRIGPGERANAKAGGQQEATDYPVSAIHLVFPYSGGMMIRTAGAQAFSFSA
jgi:hypothetical protein